MSFVKVLATLRALPDDEKMFVALEYYRYRWPTAFDAHGVRLENRDVIGTLIPAASAREKTHGVASIRTYAEADPAIADALVVLGLTIAEALNLQRACDDGEYTRGIDCSEETMRRRHSRVMTWLEVRVAQEQALERTASRTTWRKPRHRSVRSVPCHHVDRK